LALEGLDIVRPHARVVGLLVLGESGAFHKHFRFRFSIFDSSLDDLLLARSLIVLSLQTTRSQTNALKRGLEGGSSCVGVEARLVENDRGRCDPSQPCPPEFWRAVRLRGPLLYFGAHSSPDIPCSIKSYSTNVHTYRVPYCTSGRNSPERPRADRPGTGTR
jgi:hypothetical protein